MRMGVIVNPISGRHGHRSGMCAARESIAYHELARPGRYVEVVCTRAAGHAVELAHDFVLRSFDRVIAWGGDGTINEVAGPLLGSGTVLGIVPSGSGDGLARGLGLPRAPARALAVAADGPARAIDVGWLGARHFLNVGGVGFDAAVGSAFNRRARRGALGYVTGGLRAVWSYRAASYRVRLDGRTFDGPRFLVAFANSGQYGNGLTLSATADPADGWLDAVIVDAGPAWRQVWRARRLAVGLTRPAAGVHRVRAREATISGERLVCHCDGETFEATGTLEVRLQPAALRISVP